MTDKRIEAILSNDFAVAAMKGYKFEWSGGGAVDTHELFNLTDAQLDTAYGKVNAELSRVSAQVSLRQKTADTEDLQRKKRIIEAIDDYRVATAEQNEANAADYEKRRQAREILAERKIAGMKSLSDEELRRIEAGED